MQLLSEHKTDVRLAAEAARDVGRYEVADDILRAGGLVLCPFCVDQPFVLGHRLPVQLPNGSTTQLCACTRCFKQHRQRAKSYFLGLMYGRSPTALSHTIQGLPIDRVPRGLRTTTRQGVDSVDYAALKRRVMAGGYYDEMMEHVMNTIPFEVPAEAGPRWDEMEQKK